MNITERIAALPMKPPNDMRHWASCADATSVQLVRATSLDSERARLALLIEAAKMYLEAVAGFRDVSATSTFEEALATLRQAEADLRKVVEAVK